MRSLALLIAWMSTAALCHGQPRLTAEQLERLQRQADMLRVTDLNAHKNTQTGVDLFGASERTKQAGYGGTLWSKNAPDFRVGDWGHVGNSLKVIGKVSDTECLVFPLYRGAEIMLVRGPDMAKVTDGVEFILPHPVVISGTYRYTAVLGNEKTVLVLERNDKRLDELSAAGREEAKRNEVIRQASREQALKNAEEARQWRTWSAGGGRTFQAKFVSYSSVPGENAKVNLELKDGSKHVLNWPAMSKTDQEWVRKKLGR